MKILHCTVTEVPSNTHQYVEYREAPMARFNELHKSGALAVHHDAGAEIVTVVGERFCVSKGPDYDPDCLVLGLGKDVERALKFSMDDYRDAKEDAIRQRKYAQESADINSKLTNRLADFNNRSFWQRIVDAFTMKEF